MMTSRDYCYARYVRTMLYAWVGGLTALVVLGFLGHLLIEVMKP